MYSIAVQAKLVITMVNFVLEVVLKSETDLWITSTWASFLFEEFFEIQKYHFSHDGYTLESEV